MDHELQMINSKLISSLPIIYKIISRDTLSPFLAGLSFGIGLLYYFDMM